jgi:hypothetical protein
LMVISKNEWHLKPQFLRFICRPLAFSFHVQYVCDCNRTVSLISRKPGRILRGLQ